MNILVYGAGATGTYIGGHLSEAGHRVRLVALEDAPEPAFRGPMRVSSLGEAFKYGGYDWIAFTMKAYETVTAIYALQEALGNQRCPPILCLQNGVGNEESLAAAFGEEHIVAGVVTTPVSLVDSSFASGQREGSIVIAQKYPAARRVVEAFGGALLEVHTVSNADALKWSKLLVQQMGNATSAILDTSPDEVYARRDLFAVERASLIEVLRIMDSRNIPIVNLPGVPARTISLLVRWLPSLLLQPVLKRLMRRQWGAQMPSLRRDMARGLPRSEVIWMNGAIARAGDSVGVPAPVNHALALILMDILEGRASRDQFRNSPEMLLSAVRVAA